MFSPRSSKAFMTRFRMSSSMPGRKHVWPSIRVPGSSMSIRRAASTELDGAATRTLARCPSSRHRSRSSILSPQEMTKGWSASLTAGSRPFSGSGSPAKMRSSARSLVFTGSSCVVLSQSLSLARQTGFRSSSSRAASRPGSWQRASSRPPMSRFCWNAECERQSLANLSSLSVDVVVIMSYTAFFASWHSFVPSSPEKGFHLGTRAAPMNFSKSMSWRSRHLMTHACSLSGGSARSPRGYEMPRARSMHFRR
mmetsp:Transcript_46504/g.120325  ORF Transcript_46504/g.120325 Transcript_46504/m.120325 type:complete len:253 (+) Transcript_46504:287-1045(+)